MDTALGFNTFEEQDRVLVGLNSGADAAVTVRVLQEQGFAVQAAFVHFAGMPDTAAADTQRSADRLGAALHIIEAADAAADTVLLFRLLLQAADRLDCRFVATGHCARTEQDGGICRFCPPENAEADQTAQLSSLPQEALARLILPMGALDAADAAEIAQELCAEGASE